MYLALDPYSYTTGRWLKDDQLQREARLVKFDFYGLCEKAILACPNAREIVKVQKKEGSFNRIFILHMDNGSRIVARVPFRIAGPPRLGTHSEVATINFCELPISNQQSHCFWLIEIQYKPRHLFLFRKFWLGTTTPIIQSALNTSLWNTCKEYNYMRSGRR